MATASDATTERGHTRRDSRRAPERPPPARGPRGMLGARPSHHGARLPQRAAPVTPQGAREEDEFVGAGLSGAGNRRHALAARSPAF